MKISYTDRGQTREVEFDAMIRSVETLSAQATSHPVEKGADISDHVHPGQVRLSAEVAVTNTPLKVPSTQANGVTQAFESPTLSTYQYNRFGPVGFATPSTASASVLKFSAEFDRVRDVYAELEKIVSERFLVSISSVYRGGVRDWDNMVIVNLSTPKEGRDAVSFSFDAVQLRIVETQTVDTPAARKTRAKRGPKGKKEVDPQKDKKLKSVWLSAADKVVGAFFGGGG